MEVTTTQTSVKGPAQMFTGDVWFDVIATPPGEEHWHGAAPGHFMTHIALWEGDETTWGSHVTDDEYPGAVHGSGR